MSQRKNEIWPGHSAKLSDARLRQAGELRGGDLTIDGKTLPLKVARKVAASLPTNASIDALKRALLAAEPAEPRRYQPPFKPN